MKLTGLLRGFRVARPSSRRPWMLKPVLNTVYSIGIYTGASPFSLSPGKGVCNPVLTRESVTDRYATFVADPFMIHEDDTWYMFFEVLACSSFTKKGEIGLAASCDGLRWSYKGIVLAEPFHLSYPYVFRWGSDHYMIPESTAAGCTRLYRADPFPGRWRLAATLLAGPVHLDSSLFRWDGRWWMFSETDHGRGTLRLFHSKYLMRSWSEHPKSPVVPSDPRVARPAGRVVSVSGRPVRFAQDCLLDYGVSVRALRITRLSPREYAEEEIGPSPVLAGSGQQWNRLGMHHVDAHHLADGNWIACVDGWMERVRRPREFVIWAADHTRQALRYPLGTSPADRDHGRAGASAAGGAG